MPIYFHRCPDCETEFDDFRSMADYAKPVPCPKCGLCETDRIITPTARVIVRSSTQDANTLTREFHGLQRGEQIFENPRSGETVHLSGSKAERRGQIARSLEKAGYAVATSKDVDTPNL